MLHVEQGAYADNASANTRHVTNGFSKSVGLWHSRFSEKSPEEDC